MPAPFLRAAAAAATLALPIAADAHVTIDSSNAPAGTLIRAAFRVPHGCDGAATTRLHIVFPEGTRDAQPMPKPGWTITLHRRPLPQPIPDDHGGLIRDTVAQIVFEGGPLPNEHYDEFVVRFRTPDVPNSTMFIPVVQGCEDGLTAEWTQIPAQGQRASDLRFPAPALRLTPRN